MCGVRGATSRAAPAVLTAGGCVSACGCACVCGGGRAHLLSGRRPLLRRHVPPSSPLPLPPPCCPILSSPCCPIPPSPCCPILPGLPAAVALLALPWYVGLVTWGRSTRPPPPETAPPGAPVQSTGPVSVQLGGGSYDVPILYPIMVELGVAVECQRSVLRLTTIAPLLA
eukprot:COSAG01_NODE_542_length_15693_cov_13.246253_11_plen_170_part_00